jgi:hypothetical protein
MGVKILKVTVICPDMDLSPELDRCPPREGRGRARCPQRNKSGPWRKSAKKKRPVKQIAEEAPLLHEALA